MNASTPTTETMLRQLLADVARLPNEDLPLVVEFVGKLAHKPRPVRPSVAAIRAEAKRRAAQMGDVPRAELVARFLQVADEIRAEAIARGAAIDEETWEGD